jgi:hypothetical protein
MVECLIELGLVLEEIWWMIVAYDYWNFSGFDVKENVAICDFGVLELGLIIYGLSFREGMS